jgi:hypothetical protein
MLLLQTCGTAAKIDGSYQEKSFFFCYQTLIYVAAVQVNLTRNHITNHRLNDSKIQI